MLKIVLSVGFVTIALFTLGVMGFAIVIAKVQNIVKYDL